MARLFLTSLLIVSAIYLGGCSSYIEPENSFLDSTVLARPGIDDFGGLKVSELVSMIKKVKMDNGKPIVVKGWKKNDDGYSLDVVARKEYKLDFLWSGGKFSILQPIGKGKERMSAFLYIQTIISAAHRS
ncbi:hypothetical protein D6779_03690 [Candidatus Parcubacteria bacterium]|nr:MAG: hypothetical protein D6779_03690 [Candidatus Parcubacteria bacterium]